MPIQHGQPKTQPKPLEAWQLSLVSFTMPWWLAVAPSCGDALLRRLGGGAPWTLLLELLSWLSHLSIPFGVLAAIGVLIGGGGADERRAASWFLFGTLAMPFLLTLSSAAWSAL